MMQINEHFFKNTLTIGFQARLKDQVFFYFFERRNSQKLRTKSTPWPQFLLYFFLNLFFFCHSLDVQIRNMYTIGFFPDQPLAGIVSLLCQRIPWASQG